MVGELASPGGAVASITYLVTFTSDDIMTLDINYGAGFWRFILHRESSGPATQQITNGTL